MAAASSSSRRRRHFHRRRRIGKGRRMPRRSYYDWHDDDDCDDGISRPLPSSSSSSKSSSMRIGMLMTSTIRRWSTSRSIRRLMTAVVFVPSSIGRGSSSLLASLKSFLLVAAAPASPPRVDVIKLFFGSSLIFVLMLMMKSFLSL